jgi:S1-C subfamily serine protease
VLSSTVTDEMAKSTGLPRGALVEQVMPGLGAARAGLRTGDVITDVGGTAVDSTDRLLVAVQTQRPGTTVDVGFHRDGSAERAGVAVMTP